MLVQIAYIYIFCPFHFAFIRHQFSGDDIHKSGFAFTISTHKTNVFSL